MSSNRISEVFQDLLGIIRVRGAGGHDDGQLLGRFIDQKDEAAFEALVQRHGPMVLGLCRRILANGPDADDAFQATFLVLVRKAASIIPREVVGNWLYGVAYNVARKARAMRMKRQAKEKQLEIVPEIGTTQEDSLRDLRNQLDWELSRLPRKYRVPMVLCGLEGRTNKEAAQELGWPEGTVSGRLTRARKILAKRLARGGLSTAGATAFVSEQASFASVPAALISSTTRLAALFASQTGTAGIAVPSGVAVLAKSVLLSFSAKKILSMTAIVMLGCLVGGGGLLAYHCLSNNHEPLDEISILSNMAERQILNSSNSNGPTVAKLNPPLDSDVPHYKTPEIIPPGAKTGPPKPSETIVGPVPETDPSKPSEELVAAWKAAGADFRWARLYEQGMLDFIQDRDHGGFEALKPGDLAAFWIAVWKNGCMTNVPTPATAFGLDLCSSNVTDEGLKELARHKSLHALRLRDTPVTDEGLKQLAGLKNLRIVDLRDTKVTDAGLKELAGLKNLHTLNLFGTNVGDAGLKNLAGLTSLHTLNLCGTRVTVAGLKDLARLKTLRMLSFDDPVGNLRHEWDAGFKELRLALPDCKIWPGNHPPNPDAINGRGNNADKPQ